MTAILEPSTTTKPADTTPEVAAAPAPVRPVAPAPVPEVAPAPIRERIVRPLTPKAIRLVGVLLIGLYAVGVAVQPPADGPQPVAPWWANVLNGVVSFGLLGVVAGLVAGRRWSLWVGLATGASLLSLSSACPASGHHEIAAWWFVQMAVGVAMTVLPAAALRRGRGQSR